MQRIGTKSIYAGKNTFGGFDNQPPAFYCHEQSSHCDNLIDWQIVVPGLLCWGSDQDKNESCHTAHSTRAPAIIQHESMHNSSSNQRKGIHMSISWSISLNDLLARYGHHLTHLPLKWSEYGVRKRHAKYFLLTSAIIPIFTHSETWDDSEIKFRQQGDHPNPLFFKSRRIFLIYLAQR